MSEYLRNRNLDLRLEVQRVFVCLCVWGKSAHSVNYSIMNGLLHSAHIKCTIVLIREDRKRERRRSK